MLLPSRQQRVQRERAQHEEQVVGTLALVLLAALPQNCHTASAKQEIVHAAFSAIYNTSHSLPVGVTENTVKKPLKHQPGPQIEG